MKWSAAPRQQAMKQNGVYDSVQQSYYSGISYQGIENNINSATISLSSNLFGELCVAGVEHAVLGDAEVLGQKLALVVSSYSDKDLGFIWLVHTVLPYIQNFHWITHITFLILTKLDGSDANSASS